MGHLYFVRHGQTIWNVENKICGATDIALTEFGHEQAVETGRKIAEEGIKADEILYSPLIRAAETARYISEITGIPRRVEPRLIEQNFGKWESTPRDGKDFKKAKEFFACSHEGGESTLRLAQRIYNLLDEIKDLREEMHGIHESLRHTLQRERTAFNALTAAKDSAENIVDGICNAIVKAEQHTVIKAEVSTAELEKINQWSAAHIKAEEEIWTRQSKKLVRCLSKNEGIWLSSRWLIFMIIVQAVSYFAVIFWAIFCNP